MIRLILTFLIAGIFGSLLISVIFPAPHHIDSPLQDTVDAMAALTSGLQIPDNLLSETPQKVGGEFDPNQYFTVLKHLSMEPGYTLDYIYIYDFMGGFPVLYARPTDQPSYQNAEEFYASPHSDPYLDHVQADGTPEGYFELALLDIMGSQFYLHWHANYNDTRIVSDSDALEAILSGSGDFGNPIPADARAQALRLDLQPVIEIGTDTVTVKIITFSNWGGFYRATFTINRNFPHTIRDVQWEELVPYDCGIMF
ncbi:MAG: hypothetical protein JW726_16365 [Anaerolineales bacterium]|nr:hypothetical protein [Anaerolineales bacterium]